MERIVHRFTTVVPNVMRIFSQGSAYRPQATPTRASRGAKRASPPSTIGEGFAAESFSHRSPREKTFCTRDAIVAVERFKREEVAGNVKATFCRRRRIRLTQHGAARSSASIHHGETLGTMKRVATAALRPTVGELDGIELHGRSRHRPRPPVLTTKIFHASFQMLDVYGIRESLPVGTSCSRRTGAGK